MNPHKRPTYANVTATLALICAVTGGGAAYALGKNTVGSPQIIDKSVRGIDLRSGAADNRTLHKNAVTGPKVKNGSLAGNDLQPKATGMARAGLTVFADATVRGWFNRVGGKPTVQLQDTGRYLVTVPGVDPVSPSDAGPMGGSSGSGIVQVTPVDNLVRACSWVGSPGPGFIVACTIDQSYANTSFSVTVFAD